MLIYSYAFVSVHVYAYILSANKTSWHLTHTCHQQRPPTRWVLHVPLGLSWCDRTSLVLCLLFSSICAFNIKSRDERRRSDFSMQIGTWTAREVSPHIQYCWFDVVTSTRKSWYQKTYGKLNARPQYSITRLDLF